MLVTMNAFHRIQRWGLRHVCVAVAVCLRESENMDISPPVQRVSTDNTFPTTKLTDREGEVSALIARGMTNPEIAAHLGIAATTVRTHVDNMFVKLGVHRRVQIAQLYWLTHASTGSTIAGVRQR
jgi:DNA-binding NarL/FixJ family response regulator